MDKIDEIKALLEQEFPESSGFLVINNSEALLRSEGNYELMVEQGKPLGSRFIFILKITREAHDDLGLEDLLSEVQRALPRVHHEYDNWSEDSQPYVCIVKTTGIEEC